MKNNKLKILMISLIILFFVSVSAIIFLFLFFLKSPEDKYAKDIAELKLNKESRYYFFPDEIPEDAVNIEWNKMPSILQGSGYETLSFNASPEYLATVIDTYGTNARIYVACEPYDYETGEWHSIWEKTGVEEEKEYGEYTEHPFDSENSDAEGIQYITDVNYINSKEFNEDNYNIHYFEYSFPGYRELKESGRQDAIIFILYDNDDWNHHRIQGFYVIPEENYIYYFCQ